ncbi:MAG: T9SS type A sorting domain-containing protein [Flavobacteriales bacterium]|nr:T9SS type A sorting domain-containing protein [Flavobacteriales bacterium]
MMGIPASEEMSFGLQPNPATDVITITLEGSAPVELEIMDVTGRVVRSVKHPGALRMDVPVDDLPIGSYVVRLRGGGTVSNRTMLRL